MYREILYIYIYIYIINFGYGRLRSWGGRGLQHAPGVEVLQGGPGGLDAWRGEVDEEQVYVIRPQLLQVRLDTRRYAGAAHDLGGDEDLLSLDASAGDGLRNHGLIAVHLRRVHPASTQAHPVRDDGPRLFIIVLQAASADGDDWHRDTWEPVAISPILGRQPFEERRPSWLSWGTARPRDLPKELSIPERVGGMAARGQWLPATERQGLSRARGCRRARRPARGATTAQPA